MKKTAIDYLIEQMNMQGFFGVYCTEDKIDENKKLMAKIIEQAKAIEKKQIEHSYLTCYEEYTAEGKHWEMGMNPKETFEQYYNETYGGNK